MQLRIMSQKPVSIKKKPVLKPAENYYELRRQGIEYIEQMGSVQWTDYNTHDPGITILEALCYAITDLAYRTGRNIKDILTPATPPSDKKNPYPDQAFFTAREILTVNPWTSDDFRRLLIDAEGVRNAWLICKECACDLHYFAWCEDDKLVLSYELPANQQVQPMTVSPRGLYEVLLELENDPEAGDLNDRKIEFTYQHFDSDGKPHATVMEIRFPDWELENKANFQLFLNNNDAFNGVNGASFNLSLLQFGATKSYNVITDPLLDDNGKNSYLRKHWRNLFYVDFEIELLPGSHKIIIENATIRFIGDTFAKNNSTVSGIAAILSDKSSSGILHQYRNKLIKATSAVEMAKDLLHSHRNLDEDYCRVKVVDIEEVAVCADIEVAPDADIERIQAQVWFEIERYFNPPVPFYSLQELMNENQAVEDIFNGPELDNGFLKATDLEASTLKSMLRTSDIINLLMEIEGVVAINNLVLSKYDTEGNLVKGVSDPTWVGGNPVFDPNRTSAQWLLFITAGHQPRLYHNLSRFLYFKNSLPFTPRMDEALDTLTQLRGEAERPKFKNAPNDLYAPLGVHLNTEEYFPVQYSLPLIYGTGTEGLPSHVGDDRRAWAKQLKAYLLVYEQLLGNAFAQIAHTRDLFSLDPATDRTYFVKEFSEALIVGYDEITNGLTKARLEGMTETLNEFQERRNRFLNHLMARFGEQFSEYALLLTNLEGKSVAAKNLIEDKTAFLKAYPTISHDRGKAFDYTRNHCESENVSGLKKRISLILGFPDLSFSFVSTASGVTEYNVDFELADSFDNKLLTGSLTVNASDEKASASEARKVILRQMVRPDAYKISASGSGFSVLLNDKDDNPLGTVPDLFDTRSAANEMIEELTAWSSNERAIVAEHLLLRPKFTGDALYPACSTGTCTTCGDEDPYSFRLTLVMPGWTGPFSTNLDMRRFADKTIRQEIPSHLLGKICWVGNDGFIENLCDPVISTVTNLLMKKGLTENGDRPSESEACACATALYVLFSDSFRNWYEDKTLTYIHPDAIKTALDNEFSILSPGSECSSINDSALFDEIRIMMVGHFLDIALNGWQFERFEEAWCAWLKENSAIDWTKELLKERVEAILKANLIQGSPTHQTNLCSCAGEILSKHGQAFYTWMEIQFAQGIPMADLPEFNGPIVDLCPGSSFMPETAENLKEFLDERYNAYRNVSYTLHVVVNLLSKFRNIYPGATLHDCDDGSDQNPVRLGSTTLGNYTMKRTLIVPEPVEETAASEKAVKIKKTPAKAKAKKKNKPENPPQA
ncbi:MAG: hypothetical protein IPH20_08525 [Bacteroidales bacterium]|nr:hypothetical protein [Bacteroidales bacterium]